MTTDSRVEPQAEESPPEPEVLGEHCRLPYLTEEVLRARLEDPTFAEALGRLRASARGEPYDPRKHYPHRPHGRRLTQLPQEEEDRLQAVIDRFAAKGERPNWYLKVMQ